MSRLDLPNLSTPIERRILNRLIFGLNEFSRVATNCMSLIPKPKTNTESGIERPSKIAVIVPNIYIEIARAVC
jgi:hypothetical protein